MASAVARVKGEWQRFRADKPGERFANHRERMKDRSRGATFASLAAGFPLLASGFVLLFVPGPGLVLIVFGLALVASESEWLAALLDRAEARMRRLIRRARTAPTPDEPD